MRVAVACSQPIEGSSANGGSRPGQRFGPSAPVLSHSPRATRSP